MSGPLRVGCLVMGALAVMALLPLAGALLGSTPTGADPAAAEANTADIPSDVLGSIQSAAEQAGVPWSLLAAVASVATDFARHPPDGRTRGEAGTGTIFPTVSPPITGFGAGDGMFLLDPLRAAGASQDVAAEANALSDLIGAQASARRWPASVGLPDALLSDPAVAAFWTDVVTALPLKIPQIAQTVITPPAATSSPDTAGISPLEQFAQDLLGALGDRATPQAVGAIAAWAAGEGSCARNNPLDTTQPEPGATPFNALGGGGHVWNYPSWSEGIQATVATLRNGLYRGILAVLADQPTPASLEAAVRASPWGTGRFGSTTYRGARCDSRPAFDPRTVPAAATPEANPASEPVAVPALIVARAAAYQAAVTIPTNASAGGTPTHLATADIPAGWLLASRAAADRFAVPWTLVAAVLKETCDFGRSPAPGCQAPGSGGNDAGAGEGYALLPAGIWRRGLPAGSPVSAPAAPGGGYATDGDSDGRTDPWSIADASASCARLLADLGAGQPGRAGQAAFAYFHGAAVPYDPADHLTAGVLGWFGAYGGAVTASDSDSLPLDRSWYSQHRDWFQRAHHDYPAVDIPVPAGTSVYAVTSATVVAADESGGGTSCGHDVRLRDPAGVVYTYCHGREVLVSVGQHVTTGQLIMWSGWSGHVLPAGPAGAHLHFQINLPGHSGSSCPQAALAAWAAGRSIDLQGLAATGCVT